MVEHWIIPCSVKHFDVLSHFTKHEEIVWKRTSAIHEGDYAYIYVGAPYSEIMYKCIVISENVDESTLQKNQYAVTPNVVKRQPKYIKMKLLMKYPEKYLQFSMLKEAGLGQVQIQARTDRKLQRFLDEKDAELTAISD